MFRFVFSFFLRLRDLPDLPGSGFHLLKDGYVHHGSGVPAHTSDSLNIL